MTPLTGGLIDSKGLSLSHEQANLGASKPEQATRKFSKLTLTLVADEVLHGSYIGRKVFVPVANIWTPLLLGNDSVYVMASERHNIVKIGYSCSPGSRLSCLRSTEFDYTLHILTTLRGGSLLEGHLHRTFDEYCYAGEWFRYEGRIVEFVKVIHEMRAELERLRKSRKGDPIPQEHAAA